MDIHPVIVGIDVSKARLDIFDGSASSCANTVEAVRPLARRWAGQKALVVLEATGAYDRALRQALQAEGVAHARVNPGRARDFAKAAGFLAKLVLGRAQARPGGPTRSTRGCYGRWARRCGPAPSRRPIRPASGWRRCIGGATSWCICASRSARD